MCVCTCACVCLRACVHHTDISDIFLACPFFAFLRLLVSAALVMVSRGRHLCVNSSRNGGWHYGGHTMEEIQRVADCSAVLPVVDAGTLVPEDFLRQHVIKSAPGVIMNATAGWGLWTSLQRAGIKEKYSQHDVWVRGVHLPLGAIGCNTGANAQERCGIAPRTAAHIPCPTHGCTHTMLYNFPIVHTQACCLVDCCVPG